jgi:hypothetical protein
MRDEGGARMTCPKCGTYRQMLGPDYWNDGFGLERLNYVCADCGYRCSTPTQGQEEAEQASAEAPKAHH